MKVFEELSKRWSEITHPFLIHPKGELHFSDLANEKSIDLSGIRNGDVVALIGDFDPLSPKLYDDGNIRRSLDMRMDGISVFNFTLTSVPELVHETLEDCCISADELDLFAAHQAN